MLKSTLASIALGAAVLQVLLALWIYRKLPLAGHLAQPAQRTDAWRGAGEVRVQVIASAAMSKPVPGTGSLAVLAVGGRPLPAQAGPASSPALSVAAPAAGAG
jgi:hypothetical protein